MSSLKVVAHSTVMAVIILTSIVGNSMTLVVIARTRPLRNATGALLANLALADLLQTIIGMPLILAATIADAWKLGSFLCTVSGMCNSLFCITFVLTLAAVSWDRYLVIIHPLNYEELMTDRKVKFIIGYVWCQAFFVSLLPVFGWSRYQYLSYEYICTVQWENDVYFTVFVSVTCFFIPMLVTVVCYSHIMRHARRQARAVNAQETAIGRIGSYSNGPQKQVRGEGNTQPSINPTLATRNLQSRFIAWVVDHFSKQRVDDGNAGHQANRVHQTRKKEMKVVLTLAAVNGTFVACWFPHFVGIFCLAATGGHCPLPDSFFSITTNLAMFNSACNVFIYVLLNRPFKKAILKMMPCDRHRRLSLQ